jgi:hypothetical protein
VEFRVESIIGQGIRLQLLDECDRWSFKSFNGACETRPSFVVSTDELAGRIFRPDVDIVKGESRVPPKLSRSHRDEDVIKGGAKVVNYVAQDQGQSRVRLLSNFEDVAPVAIIATSIGLTDWPIRVFCFVTPHAFVKVEEVMFRPLDLEPPGFFHATP